MPLVASFKGAIDNSTPCLRKLQYHLEQYKYLGAENVIFTPDSIMIDLNAAFSKEQFAVFKYFTGVSSVSDFKNWVKSFINESSNDTFVELLQNIDRESTIEEIIFEVIVLCVMNRDLIYMGILPYECIQTIIKPMMSPHIKDSVFDKIHYAARLISCFEEVECIKKHIEQNVDELLHHMYSVIIPSDIPVLSFKRNMITSDTIPTQYDSLIHAKCDSMKKQVVIKEILFSSSHCIQITPHLISKTSSIAE